MTAGTTNKVALYWYAEPSVLTHRSWCGDYTHTNYMHATLTRTHAATYTRNTHTHTRTHACTHHMTNTHAHAQELNLHVHAHTSDPDRHIHNQVVPAHGLESCRACVNLSLSYFFPMRTHRWDPQGTWSI
jgi:hypothetical protein